MEPSETATWNLGDSNRTEDGERSHYAVPAFEEPLSSTVHNSLGLNTVRTWPSLHNGTESPQGVPDWWQPSKEVDVLICGGRKACNPMHSIEILNVFDSRPIRPINGGESGPTRSDIPNHW